MLRKLIVAVLAVLISISSVYACTSCAWTTEDGLHLLGRTYDMFGSLEGNRITVVKEGYSLQLSPSGNGESVRMEKSFIGNALQGSASPIYTDAINEDGLMGCLLNFPDYGYFDTQKGNGNIDVHPAFFIPSTVTPAPGTAAPLSSSTLPLILICACSETATANHRQAAIKSFPFMFIRILRDRRNLWS